MGQDVLAADLVVQRVEAVTRRLPSLSRATPSAASEHSPELLGCPISASLATCCVRLELRPLPSTGITRLQRYYEPLRHPRAPGLSVTGVRLVVPDHALGLPVLRCAFLVYVLSPLPRRSHWRYCLAHPSSRCQPSPKGSVGSACASSFSRLARRSLALRPAHSRCHQFVARLPEGFSHFVTSMTAPVASGWSGCRVGLAPTGKRRLFTAHTRCCPSGQRSRRSRTSPYRSRADVRRSMPDPILAKQFQGLRFSPTSLRTPEPGAPIAGFRQR